MVLVGSYQPRHSQHSPSQDRNIEARLYYTSSVKIPNGRRCKHRYWHTNYMCIRSRL